MDPYRVRQVRSDEWALFNVVKKIYAIQYVRKSQTLNIV